MPFDYKAKTPDIALTPIIFMRWLAATVQLLSVMGADALTGVELPYIPLLMLIAAAGVANIYAMTVHKRRQVPEETVQLHLTFDILQFTGFLYFTGGTHNPFSILLLAPLAMGASLLSLFSLCVLIILTLFCLSILAFGAYPLDWQGGPPVFPPQYLHAQWVAQLAALIVISFIIWRLAMEGRRINHALQRTHAILEERRRMTALGALAAAAVHELGSPLGTIAIITRELEREITPDDPIADDIALLKTEADKCKAILADIARNPVKTFDKKEAMRLDRLVLEIASEHNHSERPVAINATSPVPENLPSITKDVNLAYGLGNFIGNAASFAKSKIDIVIEGTSEIVEITIHDDGPGFEPAVLKVIGQPYISTRESKHDHMGLGIFISISLLEATGAAVFFANHPDGGANIRIIWPRTALEALGPKR
ncbi:MAG: ActS/PrrB/RegB family redox-sensitive histidine kinase [Alphaproteobacteria bacterium]|nr:ActS/PrrB/RegB family redox-sensitive histidine kinase [Alphaproteobacteria bacterium]